MTALEDRDVHVGTPMPEDNVEAFPLDLIKPDPHNPRRNVTIDDDFLASVKAEGVIEPLIIAPDPDQPGTYLLCAGGRRYLAANTAELTTVPVRIRDQYSDPIARLKAALIENGHRENLTPIDEALAYERLVALGETQTAAAAATGRAKSHVTKRLSLLKLPERARMLLETNTIGVTTALELTKLLKHEDRLARVLDYATQYSRDDADVSRRVARELDDIEYEKESAKRAAEREQQRADAKNDLDANPAVTDDDDDDDDDDTFEREEAAAAARKSAVDNLIGDGYPGDDEALHFIAQAFLEREIEDIDISDASLFGFPEPPDGTDIDAVWEQFETHLRATPVRSAFVLALQPIRERWLYDGSMKAGIELLAQHGYEPTIAERKFLGETIPEDVDLYPCTECGKHLNSAPDEVCGPCVDTLDTDEATSDEWDCAACGTHLETMQEHGHHHCDPNVAHQHFLSTIAGTARINAILEWVNERSDFAAAARAHELTRETPRASLLEKLDTIIAADPAQEVEANAAPAPDDAAPPVDQASTDPLESSEGAVASALDPKKFPWPHYPGATRNNIIRRINDTKTTIAEIEQCIAFETAHRNRAPIIDAAKDRLAKLRGE